MAPSEVRFDYGLEAEGRAKRYCLAVTASRNHTIALVVDLVEDKALLEDFRQHIETVVLYDSNKHL